MSKVVEHVWYGTSLTARVLRATLLPLSMVYGAIVAHRNRSFARADRHFDRNAARTSSRSAPARRGGIPSLSIGNITVGGTGKTPVAAWCVQQLRAAGARPAIVMRGYGDDEWRVHGMLNRGVAVIVTPDRTAGVATAQAGGADCVVLDDAFQHRRAARVADIVLVSAERWDTEARLLPAGPYREPRTALRRASLVVVTRKAASRDRAAEVASEIARVAPGVPTAAVHITFSQLRLALHDVTSSRTGAHGDFQRVDRTDLLVKPANALAGARVILVSAIGEPEAFEQQVRAIGADVRAHLRFRDHHQYTARDATAVAKRASDEMGSAAGGVTGGDAGVVCTLKDAVKLAPLWPREAPPLWYVSQSIVVERGAEALERVLAQVLMARTSTIPTTASG